AKHERVIAVHGVRPDVAALRVEPVLDVLACGLEPLTIDQARYANARLVDGHVGGTRERLHVDDRQELAVANAAFAAQHGARPGRETQTWRVRRTALSDSIGIACEDRATEIHL